MENERLRIAFATPEYVTEEYFYGGLANYTHRVARALARLGHDVHVVTLSEIDGAEFDYETMEAEIGGNPYMSQLMKARRRLKDLEIDQHNEAAERIRRAEALLNRATHLLKESDGRLRRLMRGDAVN